MDLTGIDNKAFYSKYLTLKKIDGSEYRALCPFHDDTKKPNLGINIDKGIYNCLACGAHGNVVTFYKRHTGNSAYDFAIEYGVKQIEKEKVKDLEEGLRQKFELKEYIKTKRGIPEEWITKFKLGWDGYRITVPIPDIHGVIVNIRRYDKDDLTGDKKMISFTRELKDKDGNKIIDKETGKVKREKGFGKNSLYGIEHLKEQRIVICAGEWDRMILEVNGFKPMCPTTGENSWNVGWSERFKDKDVIIVFDCDTAGRNASESLAGKLFDYAKSIKIIDLKLQNREDATDWFISHKKTAKELSALFEKTEVYIKDNRAYTKTSLINAINCENYKKDLQFKGVLIGKKLSPYQVTKLIEVECEGKRTDKKCMLCSLKETGHKIVEFKDKEELAGLIGISNYQLIIIIKEKMSIPKCGRYSIIREEKQNIEEVNIVPEVSFSTSEEESDYVLRRSLIISNNIKTNRTYTMFGTTIPDPKTQQALHFIEKAVPSANNIEEFKLTEDMKQTLTKFQVGKDQSIQDKLDEIHLDVTENITKIYQRDDLLLALDLVWHSVLNFNFLGEKRKGWAELFIIGDAGTGKSETINALMRHYQSGEMIDGAQVTAAGLIAGMQQTGGNNNYILTWGVIPLNTKRLVIIDEVHKMDKEVWGKLTETRTSGIAKITKINPQKTPAQTRLICIANPPSAKRLLEYNYGVSAVKQIVQKNEDIRRFDLAIGLTDVDVTDEEINTRHDGFAIEHIYKRKDCHDLVMFAWSRKVDDVIFTKEAEDRILEISNEFPKIFSKSIPLVLGAEIRIKLARLSTALACRVFNVDEIKEKVVVTVEHVDFIRSYLMKIYDQKGLDYYTYSEMKKKASTIKCEDYLIELLEDDVDLIEVLLDNDRFSITDFEMYFNCDKAKAKEILNQLFRGKALRKYQSQFIRQPALTNFLRQLKISKVKETKELFEEEDLV